MGQLISLTDRLAERAQDRATAGQGHPAFFFALDCPVSYLVAERVERNFAGIAWVPTLSVVQEPSRAAERLHCARVEAAAQRLPLVEPDNFPFDARPAARAAVFAANRGTGAGFATAVLRMAFAGGFDLSEPDVIAEAAAAAGISVDSVLAASQDASYDEMLESTAHSLSRRGIWETPVIRDADGWFPGFAGLAQSSTFSPRQNVHQTLPAEPA